jgi:thioredoxin-related protein
MPTCPNLRGALVLLLVCLGTGLAAAEDDSSPSPWTTDLAAAVRAADPKPLVLLFSSARCVWCERLRTDTGEDPEARQALAQVTPVIVQAEERPDLLALLGIDAFPTLVLINRKRELVRLVRGYLPPTDFAAAVRILALRGDSDGMRPLELAGPDLDRVAAAPDGDQRLVELLGTGGAERRQALREKLANRPGARPALFDALTDARLVVRVDATAILARQLGDDGGYDPFADEAERGPAARRWRAAAPATGLPAEQP